MRSVKITVSFLKKRTEKAFFSEGDKTMMVVQMPREQKLNVIFVTKSGSKISYPANEMLNSWLEIGEYKYFYVQRPRMGLKCEVELAIRR
jgi:hypothetical protein